MDEQQVRALVRQAIARHLGPAPVPARPAPAPAGGLRPAPAPPSAPPAAEDGRPGDISHARFHLVRAPGEVECIIEPAVVCNHCGYCQSHGH